jgi:2-amino-4-hydroxy-6-hydroxymethyldihydropteridine diphosphokinase
MPRVLLSLGSNQEPEAHLAQALRELRARFGAVAASAFYRTAAIGFDGPDFVNGAAAADTDLSPEALDAWLHALEDAHGRRRDQPRFSSRPLDIDIVFYDDRVLRGPGNLEIPRPELRHAFVLRPLAELAPGFVDPLSGRTLATLWNEHPERNRTLAVVTLDAADAGAERDAG